MENLSRIAQGIFLGNGEVWNFLDYAVNRNCGGLMIYTKRNGFLGNNLINNFNGGFERRYENIDSSEGYAIDRIWGGLRGAPRGFGEYIGENYRVPDVANSVNSDNRFITKEEYTEFQKAIRQKNISKRNDEAILVINTVEQPYKKISTESYAGQFDDKWKEVGLKEVGLGDEINLWGEDDVKHSKYSLEEFADSAWLKQDLINIDIQDKKGVFIHNEDTYRYFSVDHPIHYHNITAKVSERTFERLKRIDEVAKLVRYGDGSEQTGAHKRPLNDYIYQNDFVRNNLEPILNNPELIIDDSDLYNENVDTKKINILQYHVEGLYAFSKKYRDDNKNRSIFWSIDKSYGVDYSQRGEEYAYRNRPLFDGNAPISSDFNGGEHTVYNPIKNSRSYTLYEEGGMTNLGISDHVSDGSTVASSSYENTSRLLERTNKLFRDSKINSLINRFHIKSEKDELTTAYDNTYGLSRGRNLLKKDENGNVIVDKSSGYDDPYCRVWTARHQYSKLKDRIRPFVGKDGKALSISEMQRNYGNMRTPEGSSNLDGYSVLRSDGFIRMTPTHLDGEFTYKDSNIRNYMFSIENLAWRDVTADKNNNSLSAEQRGPNGGRIMWFPPYNLKFSENVNVNWNANSFIGRGEEIYTYTNTVRSGTLDFTILIDHPSILNKWRGMSPDVENKVEAEKDLLRFFAGCGSLNGSVVDKQPVPETQDLSIEEIPIVTPDPVFHSKKIAYIVFFPNDFSGKDYINNGDITTAYNKLKSYNSSTSTTERDETYKDEALQTHNLTSNGINPGTYATIIKKQFFAGYEDNIEIKYCSDINTIKSNFKGDTIFGFPTRNCRINNIEIRGFASSHGYLNNNLSLCDRRREVLKRILCEKAYELSETNVSYSELEGGIINVNNIDGREDVNTVDAQLARAAYAIIDITWKEENVTYGEPLSSNTVSYYGRVVQDFLDNTSTLVGNMATTVKTVEYSEKDYTYDNEYMYFSEIIGDSIVYKNIVDKVRYFDPAFHSITPEGFNARLTFLHQCTRQGPTNAVSSGRVKGRLTDEGGHVIEEGSPDYLKFAGNLSFGRAPYCILRIGDFFNTKICIDSLSINYDNNGGPQWDLNPEGVGVQPMYANISISFKFLGGQDITRPIERLQNAVTANYYANASIYSRHADNNKFYYDALEDKKNNK